MKLQLIIALAILAVSTSAYGVDIQNLLATKQAGIISRSDLKYIIQSQYNQYNVVMTFFTQGDFDKEGKLTFAEFAKAYGSFIYFLLGKQIDQAFIYARFELADFANNNDKIDLAEFTFLVTLDLKFIYNNYALFDSGLETLAGTVSKIGQYLSGDQAQTGLIFQAVFFGFDFDKDSQISPAEFRSGVRILGYILGVNMSYTSGLLNDLFWLADLNDDLELSALEATKFINDHLQQVQAVLGSLSVL
jgi:Ca2+-binding EF-hand superfamily protein